uniref:Transposase n=1 Tax=Syphacia muris TaxID=451379 RepID=A0A0N5ANN2_9BILA
MKLLQLRFYGLGIICTNCIKTKHMSGSSNVKLHIQLADTAKGRLTNVKERIYVLTNTSETSPFKFYTDLKIA